MKLVVLVSQMPRGIVATLLHLSLLLLFLNSGKAFQVQVPDLKICTRYCSQPGITLSAMKLPVDFRNKGNVDSTSKTNQDEIVKNVLQLGRKFGPVGVVRSIDEQQTILDTAESLRQYSEKNPAKKPLYGIHNLIYSAAPGGSSGKIGPFIGRVTQEFLNDTTFINAVVFGPIKIALTAERSVQGGSKIVVKFKRTTIYLFDRIITEKEISGGGVWEYIYAGTVQDIDGTTKFIRIMKTPSLFILEQPI